jgi:hypothetical protein
LLFFVLIGIALGLILYYLGSQLAEKKPAAFKKTAKLGGILAGLLFILRLGPLAIFNIVNLLAMLLPFANRYSFLRENQYTDKQTKIAMTKDEARNILGVSENASHQEIKSAFNRLMKKNHPDVGGTKYLAEKLIQARDILLN